jgi:hypothetical protein
MTDARLTAEGLFETYFWPLYPPDTREDLARARQTDANPANNPMFAAHLAEAAALFAVNADAMFGRPLDLDLSDASVHRLSAALTRDARDRFANKGLPGSADNELFNVVVHGAAYVGACIVKNHGGAWAVRRPLWESQVHLASRAGEGSLAVFHWWLKSLADDALSGAADATTLADRYRTHVEIPCAKPEELPVLAEPGRKLPRLSKVRYDLFYKYLKANLPELKDVGEHFPSPERFEEYRFKWMDFFLLGGGRMLLLGGVNDHGAHLFWLDAAGFQKAAFFPADKFPEPVVRVDDEKVRVIVSYGEKLQTHEMLWWGP